MYSISTRIVVQYCILLLFISILCVMALGPNRVLQYAAKTKPAAVPLSAMAPTEDEIHKRTVICFGDSNLIFPPSQTPVGKPEHVAVFMGGLIKDAIQDEVPQVQVRQWAYPQADMFHYYCMYYRAAALNPDLIIIPINLRSFGPKWTRESLTFNVDVSAFVPFAHVSSKKYHSPLRARGVTPSLHLKSKLVLFMLYPAGIKSWFRSIGSDIQAAPAREIESPAPAEDEQMRRGFDATSQEVQECFGIRLEEAANQLAGLAALSAVNSVQKRKILFFIWPLDKAFLDNKGALDEEKLTQLKQLISEAAEGDGTYLVDLTDLLEHKSFYDRFGHSTIAGRRKIAEALAPEIVKILGSTPLEEI